MGAFARLQAALTSLDAAIFNQRQGTAMHTVILAGGKGTRLRPYTTRIPKPVVPIGDMAIMEVVLRQLVTAGCQRVTVAVNHLAQLIMAYFGDGAKWGLQIDYSIEDAPLGTIGPLRLIQDLPDNFLVTNGDILTDLDFGKFFQSHLASKAMATIATYQRNVKIDFGVLKYQSDHRIVEFFEKPTEHFCVSIGVLCPRGAFWNSCRKASRLGSTT